MPRPAAAGRSVWCGDDGAARGGTGAGVGRGVVHTGDGAGDGEEGPGGFGRRQSRNWLGARRPEPQISLGAVHESAGRFADAEAAFRKAIELNPNYSVSHRKLAALLDRRGDIQHSVVALKRALELHPGDVEGWNNLSAIQRRSAITPPPSPLRNRPCD